MYKQEFFNQSLSSFVKGITLSTVP